MIGPDRGGNLVAHRCSAWGATGVVASSAPEAALVGRDVLRAGGNAYDAAVAAALAETVLVPSKAGLAGDLVALTVAAGSQTPESLIAIGPGGAGLESAVAERGLSEVGGISVGVPGAPAGYATLATRGRLGLDALCAPAIGLARQGFAWSPLNRDYTEKSAATLREQNPDGVVYLPGGSPIPAGEWVRLPGHARALEQFAREGAHLFHGELGETLVAVVAARGGVLTREDLRSANAQWERAESITVAGHTVWTTPAPTHGPALLQALSTQRSGLGWRDQANRVNRARKDQERDAGDPAGDGGTSIVSAADSSGNAVVIVHSLSHPTFGSGIVLPDYDLVLGNRAGRGFSTTPGHPNAPRAGRRPVTTLHAWAIRGDDGGLVLGATSGGAQQMPWNLQVVERLVSGATAQEAVLGPLWAMDHQSRIVRAERGLGAADDEDVIAVPDWSLTSGIQVLIPTVAEGVSHVVSDIRSVGGAAAL